MNTCKDCKYRFIALGSESYCANSDSPNYKYNDSGIYILNVNKNICGMFEEEGAK